MCLKGFGQLSIVFSLAAQFWLFSGWGLRSLDTIVDVVDVTRGVVKH